MQLSLRFSSVALSVPVALTLTASIVEGASVESVARSQTDASQAAHRAGEARVWPFSNNAQEDSNEPDAVTYGPDACVSTWRSKEGHCVVQTDCKEEDIGDYNFGLVCVDEAGLPVKHVFGEGAFDPSERFDTLISCNECLGLENVTEDLQFNNDVAVVGGMVKDLKADMLDLNGNLSRLNAAVFTPAPAPADISAPAPAAAEAPAVAPAPAVQFVAQRRKSGSRGRRVVRHKRNARAHRQRAPAKAQHPKASARRHIRTGGGDARSADAAANAQPAEPQVQPTVAEDTLAALERRNRIARLQRSRWQSHQAQAAGKAHPMFFSAENQLRR